MPKIVFNPGSEESLQLLATAADVVTLDTEANILASTPTSGNLGYSSDTNQFYIANGTDWYRFSLKGYAAPSAPDMGYETANTLDGYYSDLLTEKIIANSRIIGNQDMDTMGDIKTYTDSDDVEQLAIYLNGAAEDVVTGFRFREDSSGEYELEHKPVGSDFWIEVMSGNSDTKGIDGYPLIQQYVVNMGCYGSPVTLYGGSF